MTSNENTIGKIENLNLRGDLTISRSAEILSILSESLKKSDEVRISFRETSRIDLSCLQLLCAAHRTAAATGKVVTLEEPVPKEVRRLIHQTGFKRKNCCALNPNPKTGCLCSVGGE